MTRLSLSLLGPFQVTLEGQTVTDFKSNKVRALLAYLAVEADRPHRREVLAGLLWPEWPDRDALSNLRYALSDLRRAIGDRTAEPPFLLVTREALQFNTTSDHSLDVTAFTEMAEADEAHPSVLDRLEQAVALYRGSFLEGFSVDDSPAFEEWALFTRERLARQMSSALHRLAAIYEGCGQYQRAQACAWRQIEREPWDEAAHRQLMRALALGGQRGAALAQYETCRRLLSKELGVAPARETTRLYEQIRDGLLSRLCPGVQPKGGAKEWREGKAGAAAPATLPPFLASAPLHPSPPAPFVARERELAQLDRFLDLALAGRGRVAFVTGEAGSGKTALLQEFTRRAQEAHVDSSTDSGQALIVASGKCNAYTGVGDPFLPFREILELLTGDVEARWAAGAVTRDHACRLWNALPVAAQALVEDGPDLIDTFIPQAPLLERAMAYTGWPGRANWLTRMDELFERRSLRSALQSIPSGASGQGLATVVSSAPGSQQSDLFRQYTRVLQVLAQRAPLLLSVDDLQWADLGSISLLFHLGRRLAGSRILIVGAYRPEDVAIKKDGSRHPLDPLVNEFQRDFGDVTVNLGQAESRGFVEALLDSEPNRLGPSFREMLYRQTRGHPLFTIELLRGLQGRGDLVQDSEGRWVEGASLNWETLPARVEAVIAERIGRLAQPSRAILRVASVEGELFTAEVVARIRATDRREILERLSGELDRRHRLVRAQSIERVDRQTLSRYQFRHTLFQRYLYASLDEVERVHLHEQVGAALEELYGSEEKISTIAVELALHFQKARITGKAIHYLRQAGEKAVQLSAYQEGRAHLTRGLALLMSLPDSPERDQQELTLQLALGMAWVGIAGYSDPAEEAYARARELSQKLGKASQLCQVLGELAVCYYVRAEYQRAREFAEEALKLAQQAGDPLLIALDHWHLGFILFGLGEYTTARAQLEPVISFYEPQRHHHIFVSLRGSDVGVSALAYDACCLWCLGYPDQALEQSQKALALARELDHLFTLADVLCYGGCLLSFMRRDAEALNGFAEELKRLASEKLGGWEAQGTWQQGQALAMVGHLEDGIAQMQEGLTHEQSNIERCQQSGCLYSLAEAQARAGHLKEGLITLGEAFAFMEETGERHWKAELYRLKGELLLAERLQGQEAKAEASFQQAIEVARRQSARSWELRAVMSLCRLWQSQGRVDAARQMLAEIYGWFSEGFDTPDLIEAKALLKELSR